jgi:hypothetical protein
MEMRVGRAVGVVAMVGVASFAAAGAVGTQASCASTSGSNGGPDTPASAEGEAVPASASGWSPGKPGLAARRATAQAEIGEATRALEVAGTACDSACPSLDGLRLGVKHLCSVADTKEDVKVCKEARGLLGAAEAKLKPSCGTCAPHVDVEPDASDYLP